MSKTSLLATAIALTVCHVLPARADVDCSSGSCLYTTYWASYRAIRFTVGIDDSDPRGYYRWVMSPVDDPTDIRTGLGTGNMIIEGTSGDDIIVEVPFDAEIHHGGYVLEEIQHTSGFTITMIGEGGRDLLVGCRYTSNMFGGNGQDALVSLNFQEVRPVPLLQMRGGGATDTIIYGGDYTFEGSMVTLMGGSGNDLVCNTSDQTIEMMDGGSGTDRRVGGAHAIHDVEIHNASADRDECDFWTAVAWLTIHSF